MSQILKESYLNELLQIISLQNIYIPRILKMGKIKERK